MARLQPYLPRRLQQEQLTQEVEEARVRSAERAARVAAEGQVDAR